MHKSTLALVVALGAATAGCTATVRAPAPAFAVEAEADYSPLYYNRHVVFYDDYGAPYYFVGGRVIYVPRSAPSYRSYVRHYHTYRPAYQRWHQRNYPVYHRDRVHRGPPVHRGPGPYGYPPRRRR
jgi:hypothetical protein